MKRRYLIALFAFIGAALAAGPVVRAEEAAPRAPADTPAETWPADLLQIAATEHFSKFVFLVDKKERKLLVFERDGESIHKLAEYPADLGKNDGDKTRENDHKTPEGIYFFQKKLSQPQIPFNLYGKMAFTTDYPNYFDRMDGKTGSGIWLHSVPESVALTRGSRGCVVVRNENLDHIQNWIQLKQTPIIIFDKIDYVTADEHTKRKTEIRQWMDSWRAAWEKKDIEKYMSFYDPAFKAPGFGNVKAWERHKGRLFKTYKDIKVTLDQPYLLIHKNELIVKVLQGFRSEMHTDYGVKTMYVRKKDGALKIVHEDWVRSDAAGVEAPSSISEVQTSDGHPPN